MTSSVGRGRRSRWTYALLTACGLFVITVFLMLTSGLNPNAGLLARFFDLHGITMLALEVVAILVVAIIVLFVERRESRRRMQAQEAALLESGSRASEPSQSGLAAPERPATSPFDQR
jgi:membrane protein implicated in regulation of membrane protease activity